jgi:PKD repeat protein
MPRGGTITSYFWDFGDGSPTINTTNPVVTHTFTAYGSHTIALTVADSESLTGSISILLTVREYPVASFTISLSPQRNVSVIFDASASEPRGGTIVYYSWNFGDGNITTVSSSTITHIFKNIGIFTVKLTVIDSENLNNSKSKSIVVAPAYPIASFTYTPQKPLKEQSIIFNASASYDPDGWISSYKWDFGDGTVTTVASKIIEHAYYAIGIYNVTLTITDNEGYTSSVSNQVEVVAYPRAIFTWSPFYPKVSQPTMFNASDSTAGSGVIVSYRWDFGDGNVTTVSYATIIHVYNTYGSYTVSLTVTNSKGLSSSTSQRVDVYGEPVANFTWEPNKPVIGQLVTFNASISQPSGGLLRSCIFWWDFGDGTPPHEVWYDPVVTHEYSSFGLFNVTLRVTNAGGVSNTSSKQLNVLSPPTAEFTWTPQSPYVYDIITFDASASMSNDVVIVSYNWTFGDGNVTVTTDPSVTHYYASGGDYTVVLDVANSDGLSDTISKTIDVTAATTPLASFTFSPSLPGVFEQIAFNASGSTPRGGELVTYMWNFGDGNTTTIDRPLITHAYQVAGNYTVMLNVTNTAGFWNTISNQIQVMPLSGPTANFTWSPAFPYLNSTVTFDSSS